MQGPTPNWLFKYGTCSPLHIRNVIYNIFLCLTCRGATSVPWDQENMLLRASPERTQIDQKTTRMRYIQVQKEPGRSANNPEEVLQVPRQIQKEPGLIRKQPGWGTYKFRKNPEQSENNPKEVLQVTRQFQKEPGLIKKEPRQDAARTKTRSERTLTRCGKDQDKIRENPDWRKTTQISWE